MADILYLHQRVKMFITHTTQFIHGRDLKTRAIHFLRQFLLIWLPLQHIYHQVMKRKQQINMDGVRQLRCRRFILLKLILIFFVTGVIRITIFIIVQGSRFVII